MAPERTEREAIQELKYRYCYAVDEGDAEGLLSVFTDDPRFEVTSSGGAITSREGLREWIEWRGERTVSGNDGEERAIEASSHLPTNPLVSIDGDEATGKWYYLVLIEFADGSVEFGQGRYDDEYRRVDGEWRIETLRAERTVTLDLA